MPKIKEKRSVTNEIFIGNKPFMKYVIATMMQLKESNSAVIKARGKFISRGVDVAEVVRKRIRETESLELKPQITTNTEGFENTEGKRINVSTIDIVLNK